MLEAVVSGLDADEPWRQRPAHRIGRAVVRTPPAVGAGIEIKHVFPGEVLKCLYPEGFHLIQMFLADAPSHRLQNLPVQLCEVNIEQRCFHVELDPEGPIAEQKIKGHFMDKISAKIEPPESRQGK